MGLASRCTQPRNGQNVLTDHPLWTISARSLNQCNLFGFVHLSVERRPSGNQRWYLKTSDKWVSGSHLVWLLGRALWGCHIAAWRPIIHLRFDPFPLVIFGQTSISDCCVVGYIYPSYCVFLPTYTGIHAVTFTVSRPVVLESVVSPDPCALVHSGSRE